MTNLADLADLTPIQVWDGVVARRVEGEKLTVAVVELAPDHPCRGQHVLGPLPAPLDRRIDPSTLRGPVPSRQTSCSLRRFVR